MYGSLTLFRFRTRAPPGWNAHRLRHDLWRTQHAHAGVLVILLSLVILRYFDEVVLRRRQNSLPEVACPCSRRVLPIRRFSHSGGTEPIRVINLAYVGTLFLAGAVRSHRIGLISSERHREPQQYRGTAAKP